MVRSFKPVLVSMVILLCAFLTISAARGWEIPPAQMNMPTDTPQPQIQDTPTPAGDTTGSTFPSPTWTSIFTGFTPYPQTTYAAGMGGGMMGGNMGMGYMDTTGMYTGTMTSGSCPMMSGMSGMGSMGGMDMSGGSMSGMDMSGDYMISGMNMSGTGSYVQTSSPNLLDDPWALVGWVVLGLLILGIIVTIVVGILWLIRRSKPVQAA